MNILITGGAGFIGSHLVKRLLKDNHNIVVIDNLITGKKENLQDVIDKITFINHDISKPIYFANKIDRIYHLASPASPIDYKQLSIQTLKVGSLGTHVALGIAKLHQARILLASTSEVYGDPLVHPQKEDYWGNVNPIGPRSCYDESKRFAEAITMAYMREHNVDTRIIRIFNTYGPYMRLNDGRVVPSFIDQIINGKPLTLFGNGKQTRSFCYIDDLIEGIILNMEKGDNYPINLGNPNEINMLELIEIFEKIVGKKLPIEHHPLPQDDPKRRRPDISKAKKLLGWEPKISLEEGLKKTLDWAYKIKRK